MKSPLHQIADEKRNPKEAEKRFKEALDVYYKSNNTDEKARRVLWIECFQACCNRLKKIGVFQGDWPKMQDWAIDMTSLIINRIENRKKYPNGYYPPSSIATAAFYAFYNVSKVYQVEEEKAKEYEAFVAYLNERYYKSKSYNGGRDGTIDNQGFGVEEGSESA